MKKKTYQGPTPAEQRFFESIATIILSQPNGMKNFIEQNAQLAPTMRSAVQKLKTTEAQQWIIANKPHDSSATELAASLNSISTMVSTLEIDSTVIGETEGKDSSDAL